MLYHPDPHFEGEFKTETGGGDHLIVQYPGRRRPSGPIYAGRFQHGQARSRSPRRRSTFREKGLILRRSRSRPPRRMGNKRGVARPLEDAVLRTAPQGEVIVTSSARASRNGGPARARYRSPAGHRADAHPCWRQAPRTKPQITAVNKDRQAHGHQAGADAGADQGREQGDQPADRAGSR